MSVKSVKRRQKRQTFAGAIGVKSVKNPFRGLTLLTLPFDAPVLTAKWRISDA